MVTIPGWSSGGSELVRARRVQRIERGFERVLSEGGSGRVEVREDPACGTMMPAARRLTAEKVGAATCCFNSGMIAGGGKLWLPFADVIVYSKVRARAGNIFQVVVFKRLPVQRQHHMRPRPRPVDAGRRHPRRASHPLKSSIGDSGAHCHLDILAYHR